MSNYKLLSMEPTPEMIEAAEEAYMPFGDMDLAIRMALLTAPDVQGEPVATVTEEVFGSDGTSDFISARLPVGTKLYTAPQPAEQQPELAKYQPCGCVICTCDHETQCQGCAPTFKLGDRVRKTKGSQWKGRVVGTYSTTLTPEGYAVESDTEKGSVQIYPVGALELVAAHSKGGE